MPASLHDDAAARRIVPVELVWLVLCVVAAALLRAWHMGARPLWGDEFITLITAGRDFGASLLTEQDPQPPLHQLLVRLFVDTANPTVQNSPEWLVRLPALVFGIAAVPAIWWCARQFAGRIVAAMVVLAAALNPVLIHHARDARPYSIYLFFTVLSMAFFYRLIRRGGRANVVGYALCTTGMFFGHYYAIFFAAAQVAFVVVDYLLRGPSRKHVKPILIGFGLALIGAAPVLFLFIRLMLRGMGGSWWIERPSPIEGFDALGELLGVKALGVLCVIPLLAAVWLPRRAQTVGDYWQSWWRDKQQPIYLASWVAFGLFVPLFASIVLGKGGWYPRYSLPVAVPMLVLGLAFMRRAGTVPLVMVLIVLLGLTLTKAVAQSRPQRGAREAIAVVNQRMEQDDTLLIIGWPHTAEDYEFDSEMSLRYYEFKGIADKHFKYEKVAVNVIEGKDKSQSFSSIMPAGRTWVIAFRSSANPVRAYLRRAGRAWVEQQFGQYDVRSPMYEVLEIAPRGGDFLSQR